MTNEYKAIIGTLFTIVVAMVCWFGNRIIDGQDKMNDTLTTILVHQSDLDRRMTTVETEIGDEQDWRKVHEEQRRIFYETYQLKKKTD